MKVSFVIPSYNNFNLVNQLLVDIYEHTKPDEIIVVDDYSNDRTAIDGLEWWSFNYKVRICRPLENLGFLKASNYGMRKATGGIICLISTDVRIHRDFIYWIKNELQEKPTKLIGGRLLDWDTGWNTFEKDVNFYLEGWFLATGKEQWEELGYFDERFSPHDMEDIDLSRAARTKGWTLSEMPQGTVSHIGAQSIKYGSEREVITIKNKEEFRQKWYLQNQN